MPPVQLFLYRFPAESDFQGRLVGALERMESGGAIRILEVLFVGKLSDTDELTALKEVSRGAGSLVAPLLDFRLDPGRQRRATEQVLATEGLGDVVRDLGGKLAPGEKIVAVLAEHSWAQALSDAVSSMGGSPVTESFVEARSLAELGPVIVARTGAIGG
jgi:hypothetical protein